MYIGDRSDCAFVGKWEARVTGLCDECGVSELDAYISGEGGQYYMNWLTTDEHVDQPFILMSQITIETDHLAWRGFSQEDSSYIMLSDDGMSLAAEYNGNLIYFDLCEAWAQEGLHLSSQSMANDNVTSENIEGGTEMYADGTYFGVGKGMGGNVPVTVVIADGEVTNPPA